MQNINIYSFAGRTVNVYHNSNKSASKETTDENAVRKIKSLGGRLYSKECLCPFKGFRDI